VLDHIKIKLRVMRGSMSRYLRLAFASAVTILCTGVVAAAPSDAVPRDPTQTLFVDLTAGATAAAPPVPNAAVPAAASSTMFIDLTKGDAPSAMPAASTSGRIRVPRTRHVDLSNGAPLPPAEEDDGPTELDTITITGAPTADANDPFEETNRGRFRGHVRLHRYVIDPVERVYLAVAPAPARDGLHNFLTNLETPSVLANDLLQGDLDRAGDTLSRFVVNTTIGIGGIFDFAGDAGIAYRDDDFGETLASYGVGDYPYLLIPVIGPSNPRDLGGKVVDFFFNPLRYVTLPGGFVTSAGHAGLHEVDKRSVDVGELDLLARTSPDAYAEERAKARERRKAELDGTPLPPPAP